MQLNLPKSLFDFLSKRRTKCLGNNASALIELEQSDQIPMTFKYARKSKGRTRGRISMLTYIPHFFALRVVS